MRASLLIAPLAYLVLLSDTWGSAFSPGDLVVYRVGTGVEQLSNTGNSVFLDEYTPSGELKQSIAVATQDAGSNKSLLASGVGLSEGLLSLSPNGRFLTFTGYNAPLGGSAGKLTDSSVPRGVGLVGPDGVVNTSTALVDFATTNNPRGATTVDGLHVYASGGSGGLRYATIGATTSSQISNTFDSLRGVGVAGNQLYVTAGVVGLRVGTVGVGVPTQPGQTITNLPGVPMLSGSTYDQFFFADLSATVAGLDTLYVADEGNGGTNAGGILKYGLNGGLWTLEGTIAGSAADPFHGLAGVVQNGVVKLFATTSGDGSIAGGGRLLALTDSSGQTGVLTGTFQLLATAAPKESFRGVAFVPTVPEPKSTTVVGLGLGLLGGLGRRPSSIKRTQ